MPEYPLRDSIMTSLSAQEPWPDNVKLYQPYEVEQILLPDNASCLAVQAFLNMCGLKFEVEMRWNAEYMSPSGRVPFIKCGAFVISELEPIAQFVANKGVSLCTKLSAEDKAEMRAYMSLITNVLVNAELYISWLDEETFNSVTKVRNSSVYPWPLGWLQTRAKRNAVSKRLKALNWYDKTLEQVLADVEQCCNSLSQRLGDKDYFFGDYPTPLDALIYGHLRALLGATGPKAPLMLKGITTALLKLVLRITTLTDMKLTPREQLLMRQAFQVAYRRPSSPPMSRANKSRLARSVKYADKEAMFREVAGYKPFANKNIVIPATEIKISIHLTRDIDIVNEEGAYFVTELIGDLLDKVDDDIDKQENDEKHDFEVISITQQFEESKHDGFDVKPENYIEATILVNKTDAEPVKSTNVENATDLECLEQESEDVLNVIENDATEINDDVDKNKYDKSLLNVDKNDLKQIKELAKVLVDKNKKAQSQTSPTELDALVFGHVFTIITTRLPCRRLAETVRKHESLVALAKRIDEQYFKRP